MMLALGVGSWVAAIFHLLMHAFFKALLFLGAGSVIHAAHHEQDLRRLGGLGRRMKATFATFAVGTLALAGVPFLFSGFWSKEAILHAAHAWPVSPLPLAAGLTAVVLTAFYMTRLVTGIFLGASRSDAAADAHESSAVMTGPLLILAACAIGLGFLGTPAWPWLQSNLGGVTVPAESLWEAPGLMLLSIGLVLAGLGAGWAVYGRRRRSNASSPDPLAQAVPGLFAALAARLKFDEFYAATFGRANACGAALADGLDRWVWGGLVTQLARLGEFTGLMNREADEGGLNRGFDRTSAALRGAGRTYSRAQTGEVHGYLRTVVLAFVVFALVLLLGGVR